MNDEPTVFSTAAIATLAARREHEAMWIDDAGARTWGEFGAAVADATAQCLASGVKAGEVVVTPGAARFESLAWLFGAAAAGAVVAPLRPHRAESAAGWRDFVEVKWQVRDGLRPGEGGRKSAQAERLFGELRGRAQPGLILATGGTTGAPKLLLHDLSALLAAVPLKAGRPRRTLPLMFFDHIGGLDMAWRALAGGQILVAPPAELSPAAVAGTIARHRVEVLPSTPSFLNMLLLAGVDRTHDFGSLRVVPYGAEPMPSGLLARLRAVTRRVPVGGKSGLPPMEEIVAGELRLCPDNRTAVLGDRPLVLTPVEFDLLVSLARARGRVRTRDRLLEEIRDRHYEVFDRSIDVHISALRKKLGDDPKQPRFIRTLRGAGYMLTDNVS